jgi:hypothetical protein
MGDFLPERGSRWIRTVAAFAVAFMIAGRPAAGATAAQIQTSIDRGKAFLYGLEKNGNWEIVPKPEAADKSPASVKNLQFGGITAIATFALLSAGEDPQNEKIKAAIEWLKKTDIRGIYAISLRAQVWNLIPQDDSVRQAERHDRDLLLKAVCTKGDSLGFYGYGVDTPKDQSDKSVSQFGVLGLWALNRAGVEVPTGAWTLFERVWKKQQLRDGGWCYNTTIYPNLDTSLPTMSMTAAGVATLFITQDYTNMAPRCDGNIDDRSIDAGMQWLGSHFSEIQPTRFYYTMFGISRVGLAAGYKYIGKTDWFQWGADVIVKKQNRAGFWNDGLDNWDNVPETGFALLFLSRGRAPVMMNKLQYDITEGKKAVPAAWNERPRDVANLTQMVSRQLEAEQSWEIVNLHQGVRDLHDAPLLYMSGNAAPKLSPQDQAQLKTFIEDGGLVIGHADCSSASFSEGFHKLAERMFPGRPFTALPENSAIYTEENFPRSTWKSKPVVQGISNGDRLLMILLPSGDPGRVWQSNAFPPIRQDVYGQLMINILQYAQDQQRLSDKGESYVVSRRDDVQATQSIKVARLKYAGNWDPEPGGWRRLAAVMHNDRKIDLDVHTVELGQGKLDKSYRAAELTVAGNISLSDAERAEIREYVSKGGTLVVDVAGGNGLYKNSAEAELGKLFPETGSKEIPVLPLSSPVYRAGHDIKEVDYRHSARAAIGNSHVPRLRGIVRSGRVAVIYSPEDLVAALVGQQVGGMIGYAPRSATELMANILTYAGKH